MKSSSRIQLAQDLHDGIAQDLVGVGYSIDTILATAETPLAIREELRTLRFEVTDLLEKLRGEIYSLRSQTTDEQLALLKDEISSLTGETLASCEIGRIRASSDDIENICKITVELVRNCVAHSRASHIDVKLVEVNDSIMLEVADNGVGGAFEKPERYGVTGLYERAHDIGGELMINSTDLGTKATLRIRK